jgi:hypothetical protein
VHGSLLAPWIAALYWCIEYKGNNNFEQGARKVVIALFTDEEETLVTGDHPSDNYNQTKRASGLIMWTGLRPDNVVVH